mmetsp:Transcript_55634/g.172609  ORF Transcript_55634/g.172609 Transcript_55634/m.172609 type:complete len:910 (-) Transcript_55634:22-2751(-)
MSASLEDRILELLAGGGPMIALEIAKRCGLRTKKDVNPTLYAMNKRGVLVIEKDRSGNVPCFALPGASSRAEVRRTIDQVSHLPPDLREEVVANMPCEGFPWTCEGCGATGEESGDFPFLRAECCKEVRLCTNCRIGPCPRCQQDLSVVETESRSLPTHLSSSDGAVPPEPAAEEGLSGAGAGAGVAAQGAGGSARADEVRAGGLLLRPYQQEALQNCKEHNTIVNLPTGAGKTLIAARAIDHFREQEPGKKAVFAVNSVELVKQQAEQLRAASSLPEGLRVAELHGTTVQRDPSWWAGVCEDNNVLVVIAEVLRKALRSGFLRATQISVLVLDECHHAIGNHPFHASLRDVVHQADPPPRIIGLTASYLHGRMTEQNLRERRRVLEENMQAAIWTPQSPLDGATEHLFDPIHFDWEDLACHRELVESRTRQVVQEVTKPLQELDYAVDPEKYIRNSVYVCETLGREGWKFYLEGLPQAIEHELGCTASRFKSGTSREQLSRKRLELVRASAAKACTNLPSGKSDDPCSKVPPKTQKLAKLLEVAEQIDGPQCQAMIFVERIALVHPLAHLINERLGQGRATCSSGVSSMSNAVREQHFREWRARQARFLVITNQGEEGLNATGCNYVLRFDRFHNAKSHVQGAGRARVPGSTVFYFENDPEEEERRSALMHAEARRDGAGPLDLPAPEPAGIVLRNEATGAVISAYDSVQRLKEFVQMALRLRESRPPEIFVFEQQGGREVLAKCRVPFRGGPLEVSKGEVDARWERRLGGGRRFRDSLCPERTRNWGAADFEQARFASVALELLHERDVLTEHFRPNEDARERAPESGAAEPVVLLRNRFSEAAVCSGPPSVEAPAGGTSGAAPGHAAALPPAPGAPCQEQAAPPGAELTEGAAVRPPGEGLLESMD